MPNYSILLFDLDDTLLDFRANEACALPALFALHGYHFTVPIAQVYHSINNHLWSSYERGLLPLRDVLDVRFARTMAHFGVEIDGAAWEAEYRHLLSLGHQKMEGALEICQTLCKTHRLFIVTNGVTGTQERRLREAGLFDFFENIFYSELIGHQKPARAFFEYVAAHIPGFDAQRALLIGNSPATDILGGLNFGLDTCLYSPSGAPAPAEIPATYTIQSLYELPALC